MKNKASHIILLAFARIFTLPANAEWSKKTRREYVEANEYLYRFDMTGTDFCGMDSVEFVKYNSINEKMSPEEYAIILGHIGYEIKNALTELTEKRFSETSNSKYGMYIHLDEISGRAGMKISVTAFVDTPSNGHTRIFSVENGRWSNFGTLIRENAEILAKYVFDGMKLRINHSKRDKENEKNKYNSIYFQR